MERVPEQEESYLDRLSKAFARTDSVSPRKVTVEAFISCADSLQLRLVAGHSGLGNQINSTKIQKPGLALAGYLDYIEHGRFQVLGRAEIQFLSESESPKLRKSLEDIYKRGISCVLVTRDQEPPELLCQLADRYDVPLIVSSLDGGDLVEGVVSVLERQLAPQFSFHGNFIAVYGLGVLILGESAVGKSECALDLVFKGHQLVADDVVYVWRNSSGRLWGRGNEMLRDHMEIRGLGIVNIKDLFSVRAVMDEHQIDFGILLEAWDPHRNYQCLDVDFEHLALLGVKVPIIRLPVAPGRNIANLIEVTVRNQLLRARGGYSSEEVTKKLDAFLSHPNDV
ncbi:MAG: HPr(Ser) kinase/phosphatase [Acidobacteria bacterium]|nr:HPr(Ser) kinase/phosphatase [Acidobacteriota bacterium]